MAKRRSETSSPAAKAGTRISVDLPALTIGLLALVAVVVPEATPASAHEVRATAHVEGQMIHGQVKLGGDVPASDATVTAFNPAGEKIGETKTDHHGEFSLPVQQPCDHRLVIRTADGHGTECMVTAAEFAGSSSPGGQWATLSKQIALLREELDDHDHRIRIRDLLGGVGYILGVAGIVFYLLAVRRRPTTEPRDPQA